MSGVVSEAVSEAVSAPGRACELRWALFAGLLLASGSSHAHGYEAGDVRVQHPWTRAAAAGARQVAVFMRIENRGRGADLLVAAASPVAGRIEVRNRAGSTAAIELPAQRAIDLEPGGPHLLLADLQRPLVKGERVPLVLRFERSGELRIELEVQGADTRRPRH